MSNPIYLQQLIGCNSLRCANQNLLEEAAQNYLAQLDQINSLELTAKALKISNEELCETVKKLVSLLAVEVRNHA